MVKKILIVLCVFGVAVLAYIFYPVSATGELDNLCSVSDEGCCQVSLDNIKSKIKEGYQVTVIKEYSDGCADGSRPNTLKCPGSLSWCESKPLI